MKFYTNVYETNKKIYEIGYENGKKYITENKFQPSLFIKSNKKDCVFKTMYGESVEEERFDTLSQFKTYKKSYSDALELYGDIEPKYQYIAEHYPKRPEFNFSDIRVQFYDIEVNSKDGFPHPYEAKHPIVSCSVKDSKANKIIQFGFGEFDVSKTINPQENITYVQCENERDLLLKIVKLIKSTKPDIICGYYSEGFDDPYLLHRMSMILDEDELKQMSPLGLPPKLKIREIEDNGTVKYKYDCEIPGITFLDYLELIKKYIPKGRESFKLDDIAEEFLGEKKIDYSEYDNLVELYEEDYQKFIDYNIVDSVLLHKLEKKLGLIELHCTVTYIARCNFKDTMMPVKTWDVLLYHELKSRGLVIPPHSKKPKESYTGAYVMEPEKGLYGWTISGDLNSLYPHVQMQWNISPECLIPTQNEEVNQSKSDERFFSREITPKLENACLTGNGYYFSTKKRGIIPEILDALYAERAITKKEMLKEEQELENTKNNNGLLNAIQKLEYSVSKKNNIQLALKTLMNSEYGALGSAAFRYYDLRLASAITLSAQLAIKTALRKVDKEMNTKAAVACDTDSGYFCIQPVIDRVLKKKNMTTEQIVDFCDNFAKKYIEPWVTESYEELSDYLNCTENRMVMKREKIIEKALLVGKKKYAFLVWDDEGTRYKERKLKVTGLEIVRSSTPKIVKPFIEEGLQIVFENDKDKLIDYIKEVREKFNDFEPEQIAFPRGVSSISKWVDANGNAKDGIPIGARAAFMFNKYVDKHELNMYKLEDGAKIKFLYMLTPNKCFNSNVFGFPQKLDPELHKYVDVNMQFEKTFKAVLRNICQHVNIDIDQTSKPLDNFF